MTVREDPMYARSAAGHRAAARNRKGTLRAVLVCGAVLIVSSRSAAAAEDGGGELAELLARGQRSYGAKRYTEALDAFEQALEIAKKDDAPKVRGYVASVLAALGLEHVSAGENRLAQETFERALRYAPDFYARLGLGYVHFLALRDADAFDQVQAALSVASRAKRPEDVARAHKLLGLLEYRRGDLESGIGDIDEAVRLDPEDREAALLLSRWKVEASISSRFEDVPSKRFAVRVDPDVPRKLRTLVLGDLHRAYDALGSVLGAWPERRIPVVLFSESRFHLATGSYHWVGGMYDGQLKLPVPDSSQKDRKELESVRRAVRHEYTHVLVRQLAPECPVWLNEGIAQHLERKVDRDSLDRRLYEKRAERIRLQDIPARLWEVDHEELARLSYLEGLSFVEFLVERYHRFRLRLVLRALAEERSVERAFERVYGASLDALEAEWWDGVVRRGAG